MISFDVTDKASFANVRNWVDSLNNHANKNAPRVLVGNKIDLEEERDVSREEAEKLAKEFSISYHETSAKAKIGLKEAFEDVFEQSYRNKFLAQEEKPEAGAR